MNYVRYECLILCEDITEAAQQAIAEGPDAIVDLAERKLRLPKGALRERSGALRQFNIGLPLPLPPTLDGYPHTIACREGRTYAETYLPLTEASDIVGFDTVAEAIEKGAPPWH